MFCCYLLLYIEENVFFFTVAQVQTTEHGIKYLNAISEYSTLIKKITNFGETTMFAVLSRETRKVLPWISFAGITPSDLWPRLL